MKKVSNNVKISVPIDKSKNSTDYKAIESKMKQKELKVSLNEIQRLSQQIENQMTKNIKSKDNVDEINKKQYSQLVPQKNVSKQTNVNNQQSSSQSQDQTYWPQKNISNSHQGQKTVLQKAVQTSPAQYLGIQSESQTNSFQRGQNLRGQQSKFVDHQAFEEYKKIKQFNKNFREIASMLESLRREALGVESSLVSDMSYTTSNKLQNESDILLLVHKVANNISKNQTNNDPDNSTSLDSSVLQAVLKLQTIKESIETKIQQKKDLMEFRVKIIKELKSNQSTILDDIELLQSRNHKLKKQLELTQGVNIYKKNEDYSSCQQEGEDNFEKIQDCNSQGQERQDDQKQVQQQEQADYQEEYMSLMKYYQLYNPQTDQIQQSFPKNKTEAMMLLNKIQTKIQKLQMQKALNSYR